MFAMLDLLMLSTSTEQGFSNFSIQQKREMFAGIVVILLS
jgi:hypothetical protein